MGLPGRKAERREYREDCSSSRRNGNCVVRRGRDGSAPDGSTPGCKSGLFGTKAEDLGDALNTLDPSAAVAALGGVEGAAQKMSDRLNDNASTALTSLKRQGEMAFLALGNSALPILDGITKKLASEFGPALDTAKGVLEDLGPVVDEITQFLADHQTPLLIVAGIIMTTYVPALIAAGVQSLISGAKQLAGWMMGRLGALGTLAIYALVAVAVVGYWVLMGAQAMIQAARMAAAWFIALGPIRQPRLAAPRQRRGPDPWPVGRHRVEGVLAQGQAHLLRAGQDPWPSPQGAWHQLPLSGHARPGPMGAGRPRHGHRRRRRGRRRRLGADGCCGDPVAVRRTPWPRRRPARARGPARVPAAATPSTCTRPTRLRTPPRRSRASSSSEATDMTLHRSDTDIGWIKRRFADLERQLAEQRAARPPESATFSSDWAEDNAMSVPTSWTDVYSTKVITIPANYRYGLAQIKAMVGDTFATTGNVSCAPLIRWIRQDGSDAVEVGPAVNSGNRDVATASTFYNRTASFTVTPGDSPWSGVQLGMRMIRVGAEQMPTSGNWHLSGAVIFRRGLSL